MSNDPFSEERYLRAATQAVCKIRELGSLLTEHGGTCVHAAKKLAIHLYRIEIVKADPGMVIRKGWGPRDKPYACRLSDRALLTRRYDPWDESLSDVERRLSGLCEWAMTALEPLTRGEVESDTVKWLNQIAHDIDRVLGAKKLTTRGQTVVPTPEQPDEQTSKGESSKRKPRSKRKVVEPAIAAHLARRPNDTAEDVANEVGCSKGSVVQSPGWRANRARLRAANSQGIEPIALPLQSYLSAEGDDPGGQTRNHREETEELDEQVEDRQRKLSRQINEFQRMHPDADAKQIAKAVGCDPKDVVARQRKLERLSAEQRENDQETDQPMKPVWANKP